MEEAKSEAAAQAEAAAAAEAKRGAAEMLMKQLTSELAKTQTQLHSAEEKCKEVEEAAKQLAQLEQIHAAALQKVKVRLVNDSVLQA